jgi:HTH-type transcriptional regulator / antitoxin HigA
MILINGKSVVKNSYWDKRMNQLLEDAKNYWPFVAKVLSVPQSKTEYQRTVTLLDELIDTVGDNEEHPLASLMDTLGTLVEAYEKEHYPMTDVSAKEVLRSIMEEFGLKENDLPEIGYQSEVLAILNGEQELNGQQVRALSERFQVSPAVFW